MVVHCTRYLRKLDCFIIAAACILIGNSRTCRDAG